MTGQEAIGQGFAGPRRTNSPGAVAWRDLMRFYECLYGDNAPGLGARRQTGWTGIVAWLMHRFPTNTVQQVLLVGEAAAVPDVSG